MVLKKQTIWLLTMLSLMIVLSAYYLWNHEPVEPADYAEMENEEWLDALGEFDSDLTFTAGDLEESTVEGTDYFLSHQIEREVWRDRKLDEYESIISSDASTQEIAEAVAKRDEIWELADAEVTLESVIRAEGYDEAVVIADTEMVNVVVKSEGLEKEEALTIINLVRNHLDVNGNQVRVSFQH